MADDSGRLTTLSDGNRAVKLNKSYSVFIRIARYALPFAAIIALIIVALIPYLEKNNDMVEQAGLSVDVLEPEAQTQLIKPDFETLDKNRNPVKIQADSAVQNPINPKIIDMQQPRAQFIGNDAAEIDVTAAKGTYEQETERLFLSTDVEIEHAAGYHLSAEELRIDSKNQQAFSDKEVTIIQENGNKITAQGADVFWDTGIITFQGPATLRIYDDE